MSIKEHLDKDNLHHAYLIEGAREEVIPELLKFTKGEEVIQINLDSFKIEDARNLKSYSAEKSYSDKKKIFLISANSFLLEAQNSLLKIFEEPIENTHFFLIVPDTNSLLKTLVSRFYLISTRSDLVTADAEAFIKMPLQKRLDFMKELLTMPEEDEEDLSADSARSKALKFLNVLEFSLHKDLTKNTEAFDHIFKVREFLRMPGASAKTLMESVALIVPNF